MRLILLSVVLFVIQMEQNECIAGQGKQPPAYYDLLVFIDADIYSVNFREFPLPILLKEVTKFAKLNKARNSVVIETPNYQRFLNFKARMTGADTVIWDSNFRMAHQLGIRESPALVALNLTGDVLFSHQRQDFFSFLNNPNTHKIEVVNFMELPGIALDKTDSIAVCKAHLPTINYYDSILTIIDIPRNSLNSYSTVNGHLIKRATPEEHVEQFYAQTIAPHLLQSFQKSKHHITDFDCAITAERNGFSNPTLSSIPEGSNSAGIFHSDSSPKGSLNSFCYTSLSNCNKSYNSSEVRAVRPPVSTGFIPSSLKYRPPFYFCNLSYSAPNNNEQIIQDSIPTFYICKDSGAKTGSFFLTTGVLKSAYSLKNFDVNSIGKMDYCAQRNEFVYLNPGNGIFCTVTLQGVIRKFTPAGLLLHTMSSGISYSPLRGNNNDSCTYFVGDIIVDSSCCYLLLQQSSLGVSSEYIVIQKYDWNGQLVTETPLILENDTFTKAHIAGINRKELSLLAKTRREGWQLRRFSVK